MKIKEEILRIIPKEDELLRNLSGAIGSDKILCQIYKSIVNKTEVDTKEQTKNSLEFLDVIIDFLHESLHIGEWHAVDLRLRKSFSVASCLKVLSLLGDDPIVEVLEECAYLLDMGIMLGERILHTTVEGDTVEVLSKAAEVVSRCLGSLKYDDESSRKRMKLELEYESCDNDIPVLDSPSLEYFMKHHLSQGQPALLRNVINHWPALEKWKDLNYLTNKVGGRTVPVELGSQYTSENWSQSLMKFEDFISHHILNSSAESDKVYLAQHDLFDQIPELKEDISQPEYITDSCPRIKAWFGPEGTVSPLHTDPTHNLLCQVLGKKKVILASPHDTDKLYPHEHFILNNTSQINAENVDYDRFPLCKDVTFYKVLLQPSDVLYIPQKWWHHVRSLAPSFSISYWFDQDSAKS